MTMNSVVAKLEGLNQDQVRQSLKRFFDHYSHDIEKGVELIMQDLKKMKEVDGGKIIREDVRLNGGVESSREYALVKEGKEFFLSADDIKKYDALVTSTCAGRVMRLEAYQNQFDLTGEYQSPKVLFRIKPCGENYDMRVTLSMIYQSSNEDKEQELKDVLEGREKKMIQLPDKIIGIIEKPRSGLRPRPRGYDQ